MQREVTEKIVPECVGGITNMLFSFAEIKRRMKEIKANYPEYENFYFSFFTNYEAESPYGEAAGLSGDCGGRSPQQASATQPL